MIPVAEQIRCVEREIRMRKRVYPRRVMRWAMRAETARQEIAAMEAVAESLREYEGLVGERLL